MTLAHERTSLAFDLGSFEGFNFRAQSALQGTLSAQDVIDRDHDAFDEAEFWPKGDHAEVQLHLTLAKALWDAHSWIVQQAVSSQRR